MEQKLAEEIRNITKSSGIYKFIDQNGEILYIGKAKSLRKRLISYIRPEKLSARISRMTFLAKSLTTISTNSDLEAILLEHNLIKKHKPKFNILLKDDKKFGSIAIDKKHDFGAIFKYRGSKNNEFDIFGPFASGYDISRVIDVLRKCFKIRNCSDSEFKNRKKPCLEYQIKKCSAPCVSYISKEKYQESLTKAATFLSGKSNDIQADLASKMENLSRNQNYEKAAQIRDKIKSLSSIQASQNINLSEVNNADVITLVEEDKQICAYVSFYRGGNNFGSHPYYYSDYQDLSQGEFLSQFLGQFYLSTTPPEEIIVNHKISDLELTASLLSEISSKKIKINTPKQGRKLQIVKDQEQVALKVLQEKIVKNLSDKKLLFELKEKFNLQKIPGRIEAYDNSHTSSQNAVAAMIVFGADGFTKSQYRKFNIKFEHDLQKNESDKISKNITSIQSNRDDTAMMKESLSRRFKHFKERESKSHKLDPDLIIIDGGLPQLSAVNEVFLVLKIDIPVICMAKGENRNAGEETYFQKDGSTITVAKNSPLAFFLQRIRDEAHRFAITTHRAKRAKTVTKSKLDDIKDIGVKRKKLLLNHFGSFEKVKQASVVDLQKVEGISEKIATKIWQEIQSFT